MQPSPSFRKDENLYIGGQIYTDSLDSLNQIIDSYIIKICLDEFIGIDDTKISNKTIDIYPNPSQTVLFIHFKEKEVTSTFHYFLTDLNGKIIRIGNNKLNDTQEIPIFSLANGMYFLNIVDDKGNIFSQKFIKY